MCYNIAGLTLRKIKHAYHYGLSKDEIDRLIKEYEHLKKIYEPPEYFINGFSRTSVPIQLSKEGDLDIMSWSFVPSYVKTQEQLKKSYRFTTLVARSEDMFSKSMYKNAARHRRGVLLADGFYEYHHINSKLKIPFFISRKDDAPIVFPVIWEEWTDQDTGEVHRTFAIVTTSPNEIMDKLHNNPKAKSGPRMPVILKNDLIDQWLTPFEIEKDIDVIQESLLPFPAEELEYRPVNKLIGKNGSYDTAQAQKEKDYLELGLLKWLDK